ncbi:hypothetical protein [Demequina flava]|uniref:hypothetical protein n=1 Tax=Demequina flava TaxID=1095025 RepID=UPI000784CDA8|nr:hypothetical protein [Demequina flava]
MTSFAGGPGFAAFVATFLLVGAAIVLFLSLSKHLRKVRTHPPHESAAVDAGADGAVQAMESEGSAGSMLESDVEDHKGDGGEVAQEPRDR